MQPRSYRWHGKAINMDCGLAVVSTPESRCRQETTGTDYLLHEFPEMAKLASFSVSSGDVLRQMMWARLWTWRLCLPLSSFLAKVETGYTGFSCSGQVLPSPHLATPINLTPISLCIVESQDLKERQGRTLGVYLKIPSNTRGRLPFLISS